MYIISYQLNWFYKDFQPWEKLRNVNCSLGDFNFKTMQFQNFKYFRHESTQFSGMCIRMGPGAIEV